MQYKVHKILNYYQKSTSNKQFQQQNATFTDFKYKANERVNILIQ